LSSAHPVLYRFFGNSWKIVIPSPRALAGFEVVEEVEDQELTIEKKANLVGLHVCGVVGT